MDFDEVFGIFYDADNNWFVDEDGYIIYDLFSIITPNDLFLFRYKQEYMLVPYRADKKMGVEIFFPDDEWFDLPEIIMSKANNETSYPEIMIGGEYL